MRISSSIALGLTGVAILAFGVACSSSFTHTGNPKLHQAFYGQGVDPQSAEAQQDPNKGLTWRVANRLDQFNGELVDVGCGHSNNQNECNPYRGDTSCSVALPLLCFLPEQQPQPANLVIKSQYHQWSGGTVRATPPISPKFAGLTTIDQANAVCANEFGQGWRVAEHHDGYHWYFIAKNELGGLYKQPGQRFWTHINDQSNGNCWALPGNKPQLPRHQVTPAAVSNGERVDRIDGPTMRSLLVALHFGDLPVIIDQDCSAVKSFPRDLSLTVNNRFGLVNDHNLTLLVRELLKGPTANEQRQGASNSFDRSATPPRNRDMHPLLHYFRGAHWVPATRTVQLDFSSDADYYFDSTSCQSAVVDAPLKATVKAFSSAIEHVHYTLDGDATSGASSPWNH